MEIIKEILSYSDAYIRSNVTTIATAIIVCTLVLLDGYIRNTIKKSLKSLNIVIRLVIFIMLFTFGYAMLTSVAEPYIVSFLLDLKLIYLTPTILITLLLIGALLDFQS